MFKDGLHNKVDIYKIHWNTSNRTEEGYPKVSDEPYMVNVPCRIIKREKVMFAGDLKLYDGDTLKDLSSGTVYEVQEGNCIYGVSTVHHSSYKIRVKSESNRHG